MTQSSPSDANEPHYFYADENNEPVGPVPLAALRQLAQDGSVTGDTLVFEEGGSNWQHFSAVAVSRQELPPPLPPGASGRAKTSVVAVVGAIFSLGVVLVLLIAGAWRSALERVAVTPPQRIQQFEKFRMGEFAYQINACEIRDRVGGMFLGASADAGAVFVVVSYSIENTSGQTLEIPSYEDIPSRFALCDNAGRKFEVATKAGFAVSGGDNFTSGQLQPNLPKNGRTAFEVPASALDSKLTLNVTSRSRGGRTTIVTINPTRSGTPEGFEKFAKELETKLTGIRTAMETPIGGATPAPKQPSLTEKRVTEIARERLEEDFHAAEATPQADGTFEVSITFNQRDDVTSESAKRNAEKRMRALYGLLFTEPQLKISRAAIEARIAFGEGAAPVRAYATELSASVAKQVDWSKAPVLDFTKVWSTTFLHDVLKRDQKLR